MGDVINLGRIRKRKQREAEQRQADANALAHGRTRGDKLRDRIERAHREAVLDAARLDEGGEASNDAPPKDL